MPAAVPIVAGLAAYGGLISVGTAVFLTGASLYGEYNRRRLERKARAAAKLADKQRATSFRQPITTRRYVYGEQLVSGPITFLHSTDNNRYLNLLITISAHELAEIGDVYFNDELIPIIDGQVTGKYAGHAEIWKGLGTTAGDAALLAALQANAAGKWTADHKQEGCGKLYVRLRWDQDLYAGGIPNVRAVVKGKKLYDPRTAATGWSNNAALVVRDYVTGSHGLGAASAEVDDTALIAAANVCDEAVTLVDTISDFVAYPGIAPPPPTFFAQMVTTINEDVIVPLYYSVTYVDASGETLGSHTLGQVYADLGTLNPDKTVSLTRLPIGPTGTTARRIYRSLSPGSGYQLAATIANNTATTYVDDAGVAPGAAIPSANTTAPTHLLLSTSGIVLRTGDAVALTTTGTLPAGLATGTTYYAIDLGNGRFRLATSLGNARAGTAVSVTGYGSGTHTVTRTVERRYTADGVIDTEEKPKDVLQDLLTAMAGSLLYVNGTWVLYAGSYRTPTVTLDEDDLDGPVQVTARLGRRNLFNAVKGVYISPQDLYQPTDFPPVTNSTYLTEDGAERIWRDIELPWTGSASAAQRIAKIELERVRQQITTKWPCKLTALRVQAGDVVGLTNARLGWTDKPFEVVDFEFAVRADGDVPRLGVDLFLRETASTVYDWSSGEETTIDPAPDTDLPNPFDVEPPGVPNVTEELYQTRDSAGVKVKATVSWAASDDAFVQSYQVEYRPQGSPQYIVAGQTDALQFEIFDVPIGTHSFRVKARSRWGESEYVFRSQEIYGLLAAPTEPQNLTISSIGGLAILRWTQHPDLDVRIGGEIMFRHSNLLTGASWSESVSIGEAVPGSDTVAILPLKEGTYLAKAVDSSGVRSAAAAMVTTRGGTVLAFANITSISEHSTFSGTHDNTTVVSNTLRLDEVGGVVEESGTYTFAGGIDLGMVTRVRLSTEITAIVIDNTDLIDSRTGNIDDWEDWDGSASAAADAVVYVRETDDDPSGSPTWSDWQRLDVAEYRARAFQFQCRLSTIDPAYNIHVSVLTVNADEVA